ncbi:hypothetical protein Tco_0957146 [Tanacetum coccineum]
MAERTMEELLWAPTEGCGEAIVLPEINADHFEIKTNLLQLNVPNDVIKLMMFPYSLEGAAKTWYEKEPPNSILTWEDLVTKFETFSEAWERFKELLRACPHHGFTELTQVDTFYNCLNENEQDSLNAAAGGNLLSKTTREALNIIENKSKVHYSRNRSNASRMNATSSRTDERIDKLADLLLTLVEIVSKKVVTPALVKVGPHDSYYPSPKESSRNEKSNEDNGYRQTNIQGSTAQLPPPLSLLFYLELPMVFEDLPKINSHSGNQYSA